MASFNTLLSICLILIGSGSMGQPLQGLDASTSDCGINIVLENTFKGRRGESPSEIKKSIGAGYTSIDINPWIVSYGYEDDKKAWKHVCGGSIIADQYVLTSSHCYNKVGEKGMIIAGDNNLLNRDDDTSTQVKKVVQAYENAPDTTLAVLKLDTPLKFTRTVRRICLPERPRAANSRFGQAVRVTGYGESMIGVLQSTIVTIRDEKFCKGIYENKQVNHYREKIKINQSTPEKPTETPLANEDIRKSRSVTGDEDKWYQKAATIVPNGFDDLLLCIGSEIDGVGACEGDEGGPGFVFDTGKVFNGEKFVQIAVFRGSVECGLSAYPDVYDRLEDQKTIDFLSQFIRA